MLADLAKPAAPGRLAIPTSNARFPVSWFVAPQLCGFQTMHCQAVDPPLTQSIATIAFVDVAESVRLVCDGEMAAVQRIRALLTLAARDTVPSHQGQVIERQGDGLLLRFEHPRQAVLCAHALHVLAQREGGQPTLQLRVGLHNGPVLSDQSAVYGVGVNLAARIAAICLPGQTVVSAAVRDQITPGLDGEFQDMGLCHLKHFEEPVRLFRVAPDAQPLPDSLRSAIAARLKLRPTLVVLPAMETGAPTPVQRSIGWGDIVTDQLCRQFSRSPMLHVISALSANVLRGRAIDLSLLYRQWHADYVLQLQVHGRPETAGPAQRLTLDAQLWRRGAGEPVHSQQVHGSASDLLSPGSDLLGQVVQSVSLRILAVEQRAWRGGTILPTLASHTLYLNAVDLLHRLAFDDFERARQMLQALSERAPRHAEPLAWMARWYVFKVMQGWTDDSRRDGQQALDYSQRALDRDPGSSLALTMAGSVQAGVQRDPTAAQAYYEQALHHNPNESLAWLMSGVAQGFLQAGPPALAASETALGLAPMDPTRHFYDSLAATASLRAGEYARCIALAKRAIQANATHGSSHRAMAIAQVMLGELPAARQTVQQLLAVEPQCTLALYLARVGPITPQSELFAQALRDAGLPAD